MKNSNGRTKNTILNAISGIFVKFIGLITAFVSRTIFLKMLGINYAGVSSVFTDILTVLSFAELGIGTAITYALYKPIATNDQSQIGKLMYAYKKIYTTIAIVIFAVGLLLIPFLNIFIKDAPDIKEELWTIYLLYLINTAVSYLLIYKSTFLTAAQKDYLVSKYKILLNVIKTIVECVLLVVFKNFIVFLCTSIVFSFLQNFIIAKVAEHSYPILKVKNTEKLTKEEKGKLINDTRALALYKVSGTVLNGTDSLVTSSILGTGFAGILGNYNLIINQVSSFLLQIFSATSASIGNLAVTSNSERQYEIFEQMLFMCFWIYSFCATCLWAALNPFMLVWQHGKYLFEPIVLVFLIIEFYIKGMMSPVTQFRTSNGLFVEGKYRPVIMACINVVVSIILAKKIGMSGIILGTIISRACTQLWYDPLLIYKKVFKKSVSRYYITYLIYIFITALNCFLSSFIRDLVVTTSDFVKLILGILIAVIISNSIIVLVFHRTKAFKNTIELLVKIVKKKI